jgi:hypothetical protein
MYTNFLQSSVLFPQPPILTSVTDFSNKIDENFSMDITLEDDLPTGVNVDKYTNGRYVVFGVILKELFIGDVKITFYNNDYQETNPKNKI